VGRSAQTPVRIAVDLLGGDGAPHTVIAGVAVALREDPSLSVVLAGPPELSRAVESDGSPGQVTFIPAHDVVAMGEDPIRAVRAKPHATVAVAARLVADGVADAMVSIGSTGAAVAAGIFNLGLLPGLTRPALAVILPAATGGVVLLDVGANAGPAAGVLAQHALAGAAYARARLGIAEPRVGLLTIGEEPGKGDRVRRAAGALLAVLPVRYVGNVEGNDVLTGATADVVVTDGFTGNVLLKGMEGTYALLSDVVTGALRDRPAVRRAVEQATAHLHPERLAGALLLGIRGLVIVGHGASSPGAVAACIGQAADAARQGLLPQLRHQLAELVARRGARALAPAAP
jgi:glycerol-3-phosphate acyltransferase PlsX